MCCATSSWTSCDGNHRPRRRPTRWRLVIRAPRTCQERNSASVRLTCTCTTCAHDTCTCACSGPLSGLLCAQLRLYRDSACSALLGRTTLVLRNLKTICPRAYVRVGVRVCTRVSGGRCTVARDRPLPTDKHETFSGSAARASPFADARTNTSDPLHAVDRQLHVDRRRGHRERDVKLRASDRASHHGARAFQ